MDGAKARTTVISVRVDAATAATLDLLVRAGLAGSRSEAAAQLIAIGSQAAADLLRQAREVADRLQHLRGEMLTAIKAHDVAGVRALLDQHPALLGPGTGAGETPLLRAVYQDAPEITALLRERQPELSVFEAAAVGDTSRIAQLLDADPAIVNSYSHDGWTPLHLAAHFGREDTAALLLARGADPAARSHNALTNLPLHAALAGRRIPLAQRLIAVGSDVNAPDSYGLTALHHLAYSGDLTLLEPILAAGGRLDALDKEGRTPLALAVARGQQALATALRRHGAI